MSLPSPPLKEPSPLERPSERRTNPGQKAPVLVISAAVAVFESYRFLASVAAGLAEKPKHRLFGLLRASSPEISIRRWPISWLQARDRLPVRYSRHVRIDVPPCRRSTRDQNNSVTHT